jgi:hypothetical protein
MFHLRVAGLFLLWLAAFAAHAQTCQCIDIGDIKRRSAEAQAAIQAYNAEMGKMMEQIQRTHQPLQYTPERREKLQGRVQQALNQANPGAIATAPVLGHNAGGTDNLCNISINLHPSATACMRESVRKHEEYHREQCLKTRSVGSIAGAVVSGKADRFERDGVSLMQYASEEIGGYTTELAFLQKELGRLQSAPECQPKKPPVEVIDYTAQPRQRKPKP